jgi:hypothetical protein
MQWLYAGLAWVAAIGAAFAAMELWELLGFAEWASTLLAVPVLVVALLLTLGLFKGNKSPQR